jgi:two-component system catabolic regulation response regulator CreB
MPTIPRILIVEDEPAIADTLVYALRTEGFSPEWRTTGRDALAAIAAESFALVVLDVGLPDGSGFEVCKSIRLRSAVPVLFLTARNTELDRVLGLELGGDDYVAKPFSPREITARVKAILRRTAVPAADASRSGRDARPEIGNPIGDIPAGAAGEIVVDAERCVILCRGVALDLTRYEFRLLKALAARPGRVFSREQLMAAAWEDPGASLDRTVDAHIKTLRAKLRAVAPELESIQTHRGMGYSLRVQV